MSPDNIFEAKSSSNVSVVQEKAVDDIPKEERHNSDLDAIKVDVHTGLYDGVQRNMKQRHIQMIALAGTLGTGLFLGSGKAIAHAGPAGALLAYIHVGTITYCMLMSLGEMMCYLPISGGYIHFAERFVDPALGFALGWLQWYSNVVGLPTEIISAALIIGFWDSRPDGSGMPNSHLAGYLTLLLFLCAAVNFLGVRWFGESEFYFALIKIALILGCVIGGLVIDLGGGPGHDRIGFRYWKDPGAFVPYLVAGNTGKFLGWFQTLLQAAYSYQGMETLAMTAAEVENPRYALAKAVRRVFYRILMFYVLGILIVGMLVRSTDSDLLQSTGDAASSPFVLAMKRVGIKSLPSVINAGVLTSAFSAGNTGLYTSSRQLYGLALRGQAPKVFAKTTKAGLPIIALAFSTIWILLSYMALSDGASTVLNWLTNLTSVLGFMTWAIICWTYIRFYNGLQAQGIDRSQFVYWNRFQPFPAYWALAWSIIITLFNGFAVFLKGDWNASDFVIAYINIPLFVLLLVAYKVVRGSKVVGLREMDFISNLPPSQMVDIHEPVPKTIPGKIAAWLF
ncbi:Amino acid permease/ SLC12A domain-containing protein [Mycena indigotica]|uniref:Amino acid permease/ SLC12A domain-containing protein n=1 Tax=Mycena indigotica TaxID=2126181 RepID=A0A8H6WH16_9AGAR|nr:Amino acid permease/ SLC12A domain-containing protein [Mycena indigotica]KAF7316516.1 Amino acid permease/ SLC12A domain-containing protein [Mycena indigotica]